MNWLLLLGGAIPALALSWLLHTVDVSRLEMKQRHALEDQATALAERCLVEKHETQELVDALQKTNVSINGKLSALKLRKPTACVKVQPASSAPKHDGTTDKPKLAGQDGGVAVDSLLDIAGDGDKWGAQLDICQRFIRDTWRANSQ